jgi:hypothetical protein
MKLIIIAANITIAVTGLVYNVGNNDYGPALIWLSALCGWIIGLFGKVKP